jgi:hypothetical protein
MMSAVSDEEAVQIAVDAVHESRGTARPLCGMDLGRLIRFGRMRGAVSAIPRRETRAPQRREGMPAMPSHRVGGAARLQRHRAALTW